MGILKKYRKNLILGILLVNSLISYSFRLENIHYNRRMDGSEGGYREFKLSNDSTRRERYKVKITQGEKNDGSKFIEVYPKVVTIEPQEVGLIKVFAQAPEGTEKGEYDFGMSFQRINIPTLIEAKSGGITGSAGMGINPVIGLTAYVGDVDFSEVLRFENIEIIPKTDGEGVVVKGVLSNDSYASVDFGVLGYGSSEYIYGGEGTEREIHGNTEKKVEFHFPEVKKEKDLKKLVLYRTPSDKKEVLKEIKLDN